MPKKKKVHDFVGLGRWVVEPVKLFIAGRPALKKNSRSIGFASGKGGKKKYIPLQSKSYSEALKNHLPQLIEQWGGKEPLGGPEQLLWVQADFYAGKGVEPDLDGAFVGLGDLLQKAGIITNDRWIKSWDRSRVYSYGLHKGEPHTRIKIYPFGCCELWG